MSSEHHIGGEEKVTEIFGVWPAFHDAEVTSIACDRVGREVVVTAVLEAALARVTLRFFGCDEVKLEDFRRQNVLFSLAISHEATNSGSAYRVVFDPSCGLDGSLRCRGIEVLEAVRKKPRA